MRKEHEMRAGVEQYRSDAEVTEVVRRFESCEFQPDEFKHRRHLTVALCYLLRFSDEEALEQMRRGILRFLAHHGLDPSGVYHETLTVFWIKCVRSFVARAGAGRTLAALANELTESCGDARLVFDFYSKELIESDEARRGWVGPDLKPLDF